MTSSISKIIFIGDLLLFVCSLWIALALRGLEIPTVGMVETHVVPFSILFIVWLLVFFIAGLYERRLVVFSGRFNVLLFYAQIINSIIAIVFFYFIPYFGITPKTTLFIYLLTASILIFLWRIYVRRFISLRRKQKAFLIAHGKEAEELFSEMNTGHRNSFSFVKYFDVENMSHDEFTQSVHDEQPEVIVVDMQHRKSEIILPDVYRLLFSHVECLDIHQVYEATFNKIPHSLVRHGWFLENVSTKPRMAYEFFKRVIDITLASFGCVVSLIVYPFVYLAIKIDDGGPLFIVQKRVGQGDRIISIYKFRTMSGNDGGQYDSNGKTRLTVTRVGAFLRSSRIDELPQLWNVIKGDLSLIGPRPELPPIVAEYEKYIPYYSVRHLIQPGLSGWAQIYHTDHPHHGLGEEQIKQTKEKLSYDLFYVKNRSALLDIIIILKTIRTLIERTGR